MLVGDRIIAMMSMGREFPVDRLATERVLHLNRFTGLQKVLNPRATLINDPIFPQNKPVPTAFGMPEKTFTFGRLLPHDLSGVSTVCLNVFVVGRDENVLSLLERKPRHYHGRFLAPDFFAGRHIQCTECADFPRVGDDPCTPDVVVERFDMSVEIVYPVASDGYDRAACLRRMIPDKIPRFPIECDQSCRYACPML